MSQISHLEPNKAKKNSGWEEFLNQLPNNSANFPGGEWLLLPLALLAIAVFGLYGILFLLYGAFRGLKHLLSRRSTR